MKSVGTCALLIAALLSVSACNNGSDTSTTPALPTVTDTLTGTVPAAINGVQQQSFVQFNVAGAGTITLTLTSAVETFPNGSLNSSVVVGLGLGSISNGACVLPSGVTPVSVQAGPTTYSASVVAAGTVCVQVSDQTVQTGPVAYTVVVVHP